MMCILYKYCSNTHYHLPCQSYLLLGETFNTTALYLETILTIIIVVLLSATIFFNHQFFCLPAKNKHNKNISVNVFQLLKTATDMRPDYVQGYINRGDIMIKLNRWGLVGNTTGLDDL